MNTFETIKKFLAEGGKCLLIENGEPIGVVLTIGEYEKIQNKSETNSPPPTPPAIHPIGETMAKEMDFPGASAEIADIEAVDDVTLEDLGIDELP